MIATIFPFPLFIFFLVATLELQRTSFLFCYVFYNYREAKIVAFQKPRHVRDAQIVTLRQILKPSSLGKLQKDRRTLRASPIAWNIGKLVSAPSSCAMNP